MSHGALHSGRAADPAGAGGAPAGSGHRDHGAARRPGESITMKRLAVPLAAAAFVGLVALGAAMSAAPDPLEDGPARPPPPGPAAAIVELDGNGLPSQPLNEFAFDFYRAAGERGENVFFSPQSIRTAFSVLYEGAGGRTASQLSDALHIDADAGARRDEARRTADSLAGRNDSSEIALANALWIDDGFSLYDSYREAAQGAYGASIDTVDFAEAAAAAGRINGWASNSTSGLIEELISERNVGGGTAMVITNAIYFKGEWALPFPMHATQEGPFTREDGSAGRADFMTVKGDFEHAAYDGYQVLRIPYKGDRLSMLVALPDDAGSLGRGYPPIYEWWASWMANVDKIF